MIDLDYRQIIKRPLNALGRFIHVFSWPACAFIGTMLVPPECLYDALANPYDVAQFWTIRIVLGVCVAVGMFIVFTLISQIIYICSYIIRGDTRFKIKDSVNRDKHGDDCATFVSLLYIRYWFHRAFYDRPPRAYRPKIKKPAKPAKKIDILMIKSAQELEEYLQHDPYEDLKEKLNDS